MEFNLVLGSTCFKQESFRKALMEKKLFSVYEKWDYVIRMYSWEIRILATATVVAELTTPKTPDIFFLTVGWIQLSNKWPLLHRSNKLIRQREVSRNDDTCNTGQSYTWFSLPKPKESVYRHLKLTYYPRRWTRT
jgi:hypothetical protein